MCTEGTFDQVTGNYVIQTYDMAAYPPGTYVFTITGTIDDKSDSAVWIATFIDPCPAAVITINKPPSFVDAEYILGDPEFSYSWS